MIPIGAIQKVIEIVLGPIAQHYIAKKTDTKKRFARDLLFFYEGLKTYLTNLDEITHHLRRQKELSTDGDMSIATVRRIRGLSVKQANLAAQLIDAFEDVIHAYYGDPEASNKGLRRASAIDIYDEQLLSLIEAGLYTDRKFNAHMLKFSAQWDVEYGTQTITMLDAKARDIWISINDSRELDGIEEHSQNFLTFKYTDEKDFESLIRLLLSNRRTVQKLIRRLREFIRKQFNIEDLL